ncbi:hypothetical protein SFB54_03980 [Legionella pneumophila subsp. fraseri]|nr:hypothetical protein [Legionella pneumophila subsp. fraseri]HBD9305935.1 hypothetical protein [Legionella pneumophila]MDW8961304.1 hypothetical protein [Legionella pneumophila subsp. fraseri]MDW9034736.1 hypothetical protein [Legionella pneumophila subsp. fraseri]MDW9037588.1 hypothetical protein [Legionella pneumophila subsp. fraseri]
MPIFKTIKMLVAFIGLIGATFFLNACHGEVKQGSQETQGGYGGHSVGGHGGHGGAGH